MSSRNLSTLVSAVNAAIDGCNPLPRTVDCALLMRLGFRIDVEGASRHVEWQAEQNHYRAGSSLANWWFDATRVRVGWYDCGGEYQELTTEEAEGARLRLEAKHKPEYDADSARLDSASAAEVAAIRAMSPAETMAEYRRIFG